MKHGRVITLALVSALLGILQAQPAFATRLIRADVPNDPPSMSTTTGDDWNAYAGPSGSGSSITADASGWITATDANNVVLTPPSLYLNIGDGPKNYNVCISEYGYVSLFLTDCDTGGSGGVTPPSQNEVSPGVIFANPNVSIDEFKAGLIDQDGYGNLGPPAAYSDAAATQALAFTWQFDTQIVFILKETNGHPNGDFDLEFNYSDPSNLVGAIDLGAFSSAPGATATDDPYNPFCFRGGVLQQTCSASVSTVPEPATTLMFGVGLLGLIWFQTRRLKRPLRTTVD